MHLEADSGWEQVEALATKAGQELRLRWLRHKDVRLGGISVAVRATADPATASIRWKLEVHNESAQWSVWRVRFPQVSLRELGKQACVFLPRGPGEVQPGLWRRAFQFRDTYPGAWMTMQFFAAYDPARNRGLYCALHDPSGSTKDLAVESKPAEASVAFTFDVPAPDMGKAGNPFVVPGEAVWQLLRGDWYDAALLYRAWVRRNAGWYPRLTAEGRADTPLWMRELCVWAVGGGEPWIPSSVPPEKRLVQIKEFAKTLGPSVGLHWYGWHQIPFDNDYPHFFPAKKGFKEAVADLQSSGVMVMPYINGRLWDTRDRGLEDYQFSRVALPAAVKDENGKPVQEQYGSKESDQTPVRFAVMCPATHLWQNQIRDVTLRLFSECDVKGVYIDQIAAASARLCFDSTHHHALGGGHWWADGYRQMLEAIHAAKPADRILTTECNAEAFVRWFDGYLTWHWQQDGQVAAFPAVYGGALQMFGRFYGGGATRNLALRMKAGQQFVFGEQIGWINPSVVEEKPNMDFLRQVVRLRRQLRALLLRRRNGPATETGRHGPPRTGRLGMGRWQLVGQQRRRVDRGLANPSGESCGLAGCQRK